MSDGEHPNAAGDLAPEVFRALVESSVSPFVIVDATGVVRWAGPAVETLLGAAGSTFVGRHFLEVLAPSSHEAAMAAFTDFAGRASDRRPWVGPPMLLDLLHADGSIVSCEISASIGEEIGRDGVVLQVRRWRGTVLLYEAVDALAAGAPLHDVLGRLIELVEHDVPDSRAAIGTGWDGTRFRSVVHGPPGDVPLALLRLGTGGSSTPWHRALATGDTAGPASFEGEDQLGDVASAAGFATCWAFPICLRHDERPAAALVVWRRIGGWAFPHLVTAPTRVARLASLAIESDGQRAHLERAARTDDLTRLSNRPALMEHLDRLLGGGDGAGRVAVLFCDLDGFKPVNDDLGHDVGDRVLGVVADRIAAAVRPDDLVARWGGDEFAVVCADVPVPDAAGALAQRLIESANLPITVGGDRIRVGLSVGIALADDTATAADLLRRADAGMRAAKQLGKNQWQVGAAADATERVRAGES